MTNLSTARLHRRAARMARASAAAQCSTISRSWQTPDWPNRSTVTASPRVTYWQLTDGTTGLTTETGGTTGTTGPDLHKQGGTTGDLRDKGGTTGESASDQAEQVGDPPVVPVVPPNRQDSPPPGGPTVHTPGFSDRVQQALANAKKKNTDRITEGITE